MRIPGRKTLLQTGRLLRSKLTRHGTILGYHRVNSLSWDPFHICVSENHFAEHLEVLHEQANVVSLHDLAEARAHGDIPPRSVAITFDDGYDDYRTAALPLLKQANFPSTIFIATGFLGRSFWWDTLATLVSQLDPTDALILESGKSRYEWLPDSEVRLPDRNTLLHELYGFLLPLGIDTCLDCLQQLAESSGISISSKSEDLAMSKASVSQLAADDLAEIGCHTVSHPMLAMLPADTQRTEIIQSKKTLEQLTGQPVNSFSFPNGSVSAALFRLVEECGFTHACASHGDVVWRNSNPFCLPRIWIPDCTGENFMKLIRNWL